MDYVRQEHKIYYKFAYDPTQLYEIRICMAQYVKLNFVRYYVVAMHGFAANARCVLEFAFEHSPGVLLPKDADIVANYTLLAYRKPSDYRANLIQQIIKNWGTTEISAMQMAELGMTPDELNAIVRSNSGQDLQRFIEEMKQNLLLDERYFMSVENEIQFHAPITTRGGKQRRSKRPQEAYEDESSSSGPADEALLKIDSKNLYYKLFKKGEDCCAWIEAGRCYRKK